MVFDMGRGRIDRKGVEVQKPRLSLGNHLFRRMIHLISGLVITYYIFPETFLLVPREIWLILILGFIPFIIEVTRLSRGKRLPGQRPHESDAIGSYAWALWASMVIMLFIPQQIAVPVILIYTLADPILSELRVWRKWSAFTFGFIFIWIMFLIFGFNLFLAAYGAIFMIIGESTELKGVLRIRPELTRLYRVEENAKNWRFKFKTDDNGTTQIIPSIFLGFAYLAYPEIFPGPWFYPLF
jgi:hypothetical protein